MFVRDARESRERKMQPNSSPSSADIEEGLAKTIGEFARDIEQLELARHEDNVTLRELEIGVLKGPLASLEVGGL
jgi:hypothetical protein